MVKNSPVLPRLGLQHMNDSELESFASFILSQLTLHLASFPGLNPALAVLAADLKSFQDAQVQAATGLKQAVIAKDDARNKLDNTLSYQANSCSIIANGNISLFKQSGFDVRSKPRPSSMLPAPANFELEAGAIEGTLKVKFKPVRNSYLYQVFFGAWNTDPETWTEHISVTGARGTVISDLASGQRYSAHCRAIGAKGLPGEWTAVVTMKTY